MSDPRPRSGLRLLAASLFVAGCSLAVWWPVTSLWWSSEDFLGFTGSRTTTWLETLSPPKDYPFYRPLWSAHIKLCEWGGLSPFLAHLSVLLVHTTGLLLLLAAAVRSRLPLLESALGCALTGAMPGNAAALSWFAAGNKAWSFLFAAALVLAAFSRLRTVPWTISLVSLQALALCSSENSLGNVVLVPSLVALGSMWGRSTLARASLAAAALAVPSILHLLIGGGTGHAGPILADPAESLEHLYRTTGTCLRYALGFDTGAGGWMLALAAAATLGLLLRSRLVIGAALAVVLANVPAGFLPNLGKYHAYLPSIATGVLLGAIVFRGLPRVPRRLVLAALIATMALIARDRIAPFQRHFSRIEAVATTLLNEWPHQGTVVVVNLPMELNTLFPWVLPDSAPRAQPWTMVTTRTTCARPATENALPPPVGDAWFEFDGRGLHRTTWDQIDRRLRAPPIWLTNQPHAFPFPEETISEVLAEERPLEEANLVSDPPRLSPSPSPPGVAKLIAHRVVPEKGYEWEVEVELERPSLLVLSYVPLPGFVSEFFLLDTFSHPAPPPLRVEVTDARSGQRLDLPVHFVSIYFPGLLLPAGSHRLHALGLLPWVERR